MSIAFKKPHVVAAAALLAALLSPVAHAAAEAVTNGGFDTHTLDGWSASGGASLSCVYAVNSACSATLFNGGLSQTLATVAGTGYSYSFWIDNGAGIDFSFTADNIELFGLHNPADSSGFYQVTGSFVAAGASTTIAFAVSGVSAQYIDQVSVMGAVPTAALPEPASLLLAGTALAALGFVPRRRRT